MFETEIRYNLTNLRKLAKKYPGVVHEETVNVMDLVVRRLEKEVVEGTPRGVGGDAGLAGSIFGEVTGTGMPVKGIVGSPMEYAVVVEKGRRPGKRMPPVGPIALWAQRKLGVSAEEAQSVGFAIARTIAIKGFEGAYMFKNAWNENERWVQDMLYGIAGRVVKRLESGTN